VITTARALVVGDEFAAVGDERARVTMILEVAGE